MPLPIRILVVDDDHHARLIISSIVAQAGYQAFGLDSGEELLEVALKQRPGAILLDANMPKVNGFTVCKQLKNDPRTENIPVIIVTGYVEKEARARADSVGADDVICKPFDAEHLRQVLQEVLEMSRVHTHLGLDADKIVGAFDKKD